MNTATVDRVIASLCELDWMFLNDSFNEMSLSISPQQRQRAAAELRTLLADNAALRRHAEEHEASAHGFRKAAEEWKRRFDLLNVATVPSTTASYKGVTYREGKWWKNGWGISAELLSQMYSMDIYTEEDYRALLALKEEAEKVVTVESVVEKWWWSKSTPLNSECLPDLCAKLRAAFPHIDAPRELTAQEHVEALMGMGAKQMRLERAWHSRNVDVDAPVLVLQEVAK